MSWSWSTIDSPVGELLLVAEGSVLREVRFEGERAHVPSREWRSGGRVVARAERQLEEYFAGERRAFDLPLGPVGTPFQRRVWAALERIPYGETISYGELARRVGNPSASRAVGAANGRNPIPIVIPCHRVIGSTGKLTGFGGGLDVKRALLDLETAKTGLYRS